MKVKATLTSKIKGKLYLLKLFIIFRSNKSSKLGAAEQMVLWSLYALARSCDAFDKNTLPLLLFSASAPPCCHCRHCRGNDGNDCDFCFCKKTKIRQKEAIGQGVSTFKVLLPALALWAAGQRVHFFFKFTCKGPLQII
jgi:hypothetical protein